jgi:type IV secretory pathway VirB10-like protein
MKILCVQCTALIAFMMLVPQPATAFEDTRLGQQEQDKNQVKQRGQQNLEPKPWEARPWAPKPSASKPWESRPWDSAAEEVRPKDLRSGEERKAADERRRVGRKARKERSEKKENTAEVSSYQDRVKQRQNKWQRHQMESERYYPAGMR